MDGSATPRRRLLVPVPLSLIHFRWAGERRIGAPMTPARREQALSRTRMQ